MLTQRVRSLEAHVAVHKKDQGAKRQLRIVVSKRRRLYKYLKRKDLTAYYNVIKDQVVDDKFLMFENLIDSSEMAVPKETRKKSKRIIEEKQKLKTYKKTGKSF